MTFEIVYKKGLPMVRRGCKTCGNTTVKGNWIWKEIGVMQYSMRTRPWIIIRIRNLLSAEAKKVMAN